MKRMIKSAFVAAAMVTVMAAVSAADAAKPAAAKAPAAPNYIAVTIAEVDTNKDGKVTVEELTQYWVKKDAKVDKKAVEAAFAAADANKDKSLSKEEVLKAGGKEK